VEKNSPCRPTGPLIRKGDRDESRPTIHVSGRASSRREEWHRGLTTGRAFSRRVRDIALVQRGKSRSRRSPPARHDACENRRCALRDTSGWRLWGSGGRPFMGPPRMSPRNSRTYVRARMADLRRRQSVGSDVAQEGASARAAPMRSRAITLVWRPGSGSGPSRSAPMRSTFGVDCRSNVQPSRTARAEQGTASRRRAPRPEWGRRGSSSKGPAGRGFQAERGRDRHGIPRASGARR